MVKCIIYSKPKFTTYAVKLPVVAVHATTTVVDLGCLEQFRYPFDLRFCISDSTF